MEQNILPLATRSYPAYAQYSGGSLPAETCTPVDLLSNKFAQFPQQPKSQVTGQYSIKTEHLSHDNHRNDDPTSYGRLNNSSTKLLSSKNKT
jgi:hypothetical protein